MDNLQYEALRTMFHARRLHPWIPEHSIFIEAQLAQLKILEPKDYEGFKEFYDQKLKNYKVEPEPPQDVLRAPTEEDKEIKAEEDGEKIKEEEPKKVKKVKKSK